MNCLCLVMKWTVQVCYEMNHTYLVMKGIVYVYHEMNHTYLIIKVKLYMLDRKMKMCTLEMKVKLYISCYGNESEFIKYESRIINV